MSLRHATGSAGLLEFTSPMPVIWAYTDTMKAAYYLGWGLAVLSFISGGAEIIAAASVEGHVVYLGMRDTWYTLWPASFVHSGVWFKGLGVEWLWRDVLLSVMVLPAWLILGIPAAFFIVRYRPRKPTDDEVEETNLLEVYQNLSESARADETFDPREDDMAPTHFEPDPDGFEPSDHLVKARPIAGDSWGDISWADKDDERYVDMRIEEEPMELGPDDRASKAHESEGEAKPPCPSRND